MDTWIGALDWLRRAYTRKVGVLIRLWIRYQQTRVGVQRPPQTGSGISSDFGSIQFCRKIIFVDTGNSGKRLALGQTGTNLV